MCKMGQFWPKSKVIEGGNSLILWKKEIVYVLLFYGS